MKDIQLLILRYFTNDKDKNSIANNISNQLLKNKPYIYNPTGKTEEYIKKFFKKNDCRDEKQNYYNILMIGFDRSTQDPVEFWIGKCRRRYNYKIYVESGSKIHKKRGLQLQNIISKDFTYKKLNDESTYVISYKIDSRKFYEWFNKPINTANYEHGKFNKLSINNISESIRSREKSLSDLAQKSEYAKRALGYKEPSSKRSEYQRDRERIVHSKAYRRLVDKAQIYTSSKGDHYRTRLTHSLEVNQISRGIATSLNLNLDLTEAIAIGHDIGHTPFGHEGERVINDCLLGKLNKITTASKLKLGGFKHNFQSVRILSYLEEKYMEHEGLDLTYQTLEGILKHTKLKKCKYKDTELEEKCYKCDNKCFDIDKFLIIGNADNLRLNFNFPTTLEGQVVRIADEIAQRGHDLDDGIASGVLNIDELKEDFKYAGMEELVKAIDDAKKTMNKAIKNNRFFIDETDILRASIVPSILDYFIQELITNSEKEINDYIERDGKFEHFKQYHFVDEELIKYNGEVKNHLDQLEDIITEKVINSYEVNRFDGKSAYIIKKLIEAYYTNPKQLPDTVLRRMYREIKKYTSNVVDLRTGSREAVDNEIGIYTGKVASDNSSEDEIKQEKFLRAIADHVGSMTDNYAHKEYARLYLPE